MLLIIKCFSRGCFQALSSSVIHCFFLIFVPLSPRRVSCYGGFAGLFLFPFRDLLFCLSYACVVCLFLFQVFFLALRLLVEVFVRHRQSSFLHGGFFCVSVWANQEVWVFLGRGGNVIERLSLIINK